MTYLLFFVMRKSRRTKRFAYVYSFVAKDSLDLKRSEGGTRESNFLILTPYGSYMDASVSPRGGYSSFKHSHTIFPYTGSAFVLNVQLAYRIRYLCFLCLPSPEDFGYDKEQIE